MRRDIDKVIFERAKGGRTWAKKTPRATSVALDPSGEQIDESSNHIRRQRQKWRNEHYNSLERFLVRNTGRPWSKVYSEICASTDSRTGLGAEIRCYVECLVATNCQIQGRKVLTVCSKEVHGLYVHPKSGLLLRTRPLN